MKVYELINELVTLPAGADVEFSGALSLDEMEEIDTDLYSFRVPITDIDATNVDEDMLVTIN